jgi:predicted permease
MFTIAMTLSVISSALRVWLIARLYLMDQRREYPLFVAYNILAILTLVATLCLTHDTVPYFLTYWIGEATASVLALLVIIAIFKPAAEVLYIENPRRRLVLPIAVLSVIAIPIWQGIYRPVGPSLFGHAASGIYSFVLAILSLQAIILLACLALSRSIPWTNYDFAIVSGFGVSAVMKWVAYLVRWNYGSRFESWFQILLPGSTLGAVLVWLLAFSRSEPPTIKQEPDPSELQQLIDLLEEHTEYVRQILKHLRFRTSMPQNQPRIVGALHLHENVADFVRGLRYSVRRLSKRPTLAVTAVLTLAVGIGANVALFSVANAVLIRPLPYPNASRLVMVWQTHLPAQDMRNVTSPANFLNWRAENNVFEQMAAIYSDTTVVGGGSPEQVVRQSITPNLFSMLGVDAAIGRTFQDPSDRTEGADQLAVLSYGFWQRRFAANPHVLGAKILVDGVPLTIVGVMPRNFTFLVKERSFTQRQPDLWVPMVFTPEISKRRGPYIQVIALLRPGINVDRAQSVMRNLAAVLAERDPAAQKDWSVTLTPLRDQLAGEMRPALRILLGAVGLVILIACANVAILLMAQAEKRHQEIAVRMALGASAWEATRQIFSDSIVLAGAGGLLGVALAGWGTSVIITLAPTNLIPIDTLHIDIRVLVFAGALTLLAGLVSGMIPTIQASRTKVSEVLKRRAAGNDEPTATRMRSAFVVMEMALAIIVIIAAGLLIRSFARLTAVDPGFRAQDLLTVRVELPTKKYVTDAQQSRFFAEVMRKVRLIPGVRSASADAFLPFTGLIASTRVGVPGRPAQDSDQLLSVAVAPIESQFFETMGIPLLEGRSFNQGEEREPSHKVVISEDLAKRLFPNEDAVGKLVTIQMGHRPPSEVIGVVREVKHAGLDAGEHVTAYWPFPEQTFPYMTLVLRTDVEPLSVVPAVRQAVASVDKDQPIADIHTMEDLLAASVARNRFNTMLLALFAGVALLLAVIGAYGVISGNVEERTREIGIRMAVGADRAQIMWLVLREGMILAVIGVILGTGLALLVTRLMMNLLFLISPTDPLTFVFVAGVVLLVALGACFIPARRATTVHPLTALRYE